MIAFLMEKLNVNIDGVWETNEIIAAIAAVIVVALIIGLLIFLAAKIVRGVNPRKSTIFSHRRNKYKSRIGKNNDKYL